MIRIVEAPPRSGKSYYVVNYLTKFCVYENLYKEWVLKANVLIISNIEGLKIKHLDLTELLKRFTVEEFFTIENFQKIKEKYKVQNIVLCIDEAQKIFDRKYYNKDVFYFFQYHGHEGIDIFIMTQSISTICNAIPPLCEFIVRVSTRSKSIIGTFRYKFVDHHGLFLGSEVLRKSKQVFAAYKSFSSDEFVKPKNAILHYAKLLLLFMVLGVFGFKTAYAAFMGKGKRTKEQINAIDVQKRKEKGVYVNSSTVQKPVEKKPVDKPVVKYIRVKDKEKPPAAKLFIPPAPVSMIPQNNKIEEKKTGPQKYKVQSVIQINDQTWLKVNGKILDQKKYADYDAENNTVVVDSKLFDS